MIRAYRAAAECHASHVFVVNVAKKCMPPAHPEAARYLIRKQDETVKRLELAYSVKLVLRERQISPRKKLQDPGQLETEPKPPEY